MNRRRTGLLVGAAVAGLAGCGAHAHRAAPPQPTLPRELARQLARESDLVATRLDAGDACGALAAARELHLRTIDAVNRHQVPALLQEPLLGAAADLAGRIQCVQAPAPKRHDRGKHEGEHKHGKHGQGGD